MSGSARNFRSGRDRTEDRQPPTKIRKQNVYPGTERRSDYRVWSDIEENHSEFLPREPFHGNRYVQRDDRRKLERERSPGFDRWDGENKSRSPSDGWDPPSRGKGMSQGPSWSRDRRMSRSPSRSRGRARSRSRSQSRGRARDRSPFDVHRRVSYGTAERNMTNSSSQPCKFFAAGNCRNGTQCKFFHPDNLGSHDGKYYENDVEPRRRGRAEYRDEVEISNNYERDNRNVSADYDLKQQQPIRSGNKPTCKDFAVGKCHRDNCRFSHDDQTADDKWSDERRGRNHDERIKSWDGPTWDDHNKTSDPVKLSGWGEKVHDSTVGEKRDNNGKSRNFHDDQTADDKWSDERRGRNHDERIKSWDGPSWDDQNKTSDPVKLSGWGEKDHDSTVGEKRDDNGQSRNFHDTKDALDSVKSFGWGEGSFVNPLHDSDLAGKESRGIERRRQNSHEKSKVWNDGPTREDVKDSSDAAKSLGLGDNLVGRMNLHDPVAAEHRSDDRRGRDRRHQNSNEKSNIWNSPTWDDVKDSSDAAKSSGWGDNPVGRLNLQDPVAAEHRGDDRRDRDLYEVKDSSDAAKSTGCGEGSVVSVKRGDDRQSWNFHDTKDPLDAAAKLTGGGEGSFVNPRFHGNVLTAEASRGNDRLHQASSEKSKVWNSPTWDDVKDTSDDAKPTSWGDHTVGTTNLQDPVAAKHQSDVRRDPDLYEVKDTSYAAKSTGWGDDSVMSMKPHDQVQEQGDDWRGLNSYVKTEPAIAPTLGDVKSILDSAKASGWGNRFGGISTFNGQMIADAGVPHIIHDNPNEISTRADEQNLTLEAGSYQTAIRLSENCNVIPTFEDFNALHEVKDSSNQNDKTLGSLPIPTSIDDSGACFSSNGHNIDLNIPFQNVNPETEAVALPKETNKQPSLAVSEIVVNPKVGGTIGGKQEQENVNAKIEEINNNASKDEKAMRVFKIALVEFVKEILKPKWKEGQMSREVHKTIVKKTVDKVSSTISGDQIPNTQEKVNQYLSFSKGKISKLVQAYVERFHKS